MSTTSLTSVFRELFLAPLSAACESEQDYRRIWVKWLTDQKKALTGDNGELLPGIDVQKLLASAPVVHLDGAIEVGITMRIAGVQEFSAELKAGLSLGPIYAAGGFGFVSRTTQESVFQASTRYVITNSERDLQKYLETRGIPVHDAKDLDNAITMLSKPLG